MKLLKIDFKKLLQHVNKYVNEHPDNIGAIILLITIISMLLVAMTDTRVDDLILCILLISTSIFWIIQEHTWYKNLIGL